MSPHPPSAPAAEDVLNAALHAAVCAVCGVHHAAEADALSPAAVAALAHAEAEAAAEPIVCRIVAHPRLRQAVVRALAREAAELVREGWHLLHPTTAPAMRSGTA